MKSWNEPIVQQLDEKTFVVRDDIIPGGTKRTFVDFLIESTGADEIVYASPVYGGAQIAIAFAARELGIRATIFCAKRNEPHARTIEAKNAGAKIVLVPNGYFSNVTSKARRYCDATGATLLPFGLDCPAAIEAISVRARRVQEIIDTKIESVWAVAGSGVLIRGIQNGLAAQKYNAVQIGRKLNQSDVGRATIHVCPLTFETNAKIKPPFPSCSNYDAKAWAPFVLDSGTKLLWNVMA